MHHHSWSFQKSLVQENPQTRNEWNRKFEDTQSSTNLQIIDCLWNRIWTAAKEEHSATKRRKAGTETNVTKIKTFPRRTRANYSSSRCVFVVPCNWAQGCFLPLLVILVWFVFGGFRCCTTERCVVCALKNWNSLLNFLLTVKIIIFCS